MVSRIGTGKLTGQLEEVGLNTLYDLLKNPRRRMALRYLVRSREETATIGELAEQLAAWENDLPLAGVNSTLRKRTYNTLQQHHLPKLAEAGLVEFDRARGHVRLIADPQQLTLVLGVLPRINSGGVTRFLLLGTLFWFALMLNWFSVHVFGFFPPGTGQYIFGASFAALFGIHTYLLYRFLHPRRLLH